MKILGIETSCDETAASVVEVAFDKNHVTILSSITATSLNLHAKTGGIIPEVAARNQIKDIIPVIYQALEQAGILRLTTSNQRPHIDALAVTYGPGLIGSLLVGVETAKTLSYLWDIPLIPVNHLFGHLYANWISSSSLFSVVSSQNHVDQSSVGQSEKLFKTPEFPAIGLIVSGGHTDLVLMKSHTDSTWLGGTRDDAAGEAFDKIGRMLGLSYPAGPMIEELAKKGNEKAFHFPRPLMYDKEFDFSFSGLKTAVLRVVEKQKKLDDVIIANICRGVQDAIIDVLVYKTLLAAEKFDAQSIILGGGVSANEALRDTLRARLTTSDQRLATNFFVPQKNLSTDNGAMIAAAALFQGEEKKWRDVTANPELYFD